MCKKKDKTRQSDAKISLMTKKNFRPLVGFPPTISKMLQLANTPPILRLKDLYLERAGQTNVETKILPVTEGELNYHVNQTFD